MKTILEINNSLDAMSKYLFKNCFAFETLNLLKRKMYSLSKSEEENLLENFDENTFIDILEYIIHSFQFYESKNVMLPIGFKQKLILKYINEYDQIVSSKEDLFYYSKQQNGLTKKILERSSYNGR